MITLERKAVREKSVNSNKKSSGGIVSQRVMDSSTMQLRAKEQSSIFGNTVIQPKTNNMGLPDNLKSGIESLSGQDMSDVKVHYNSSKPAQLNAFAFAQGSDIHLGSGQEKHLPHEAWHVVQQKQGRVQPTTQMKSGIAINDDRGLEREADVMGARAMDIGGSIDTLPRQMKYTSVSSGTKQMFFGRSKSSKIAKSRKKIDKLKVKFDTIKDTYLNTYKLDLAYDIKKREKLKEKASSIKKEVENETFYLKKTLNANINDERLKRREIHNNNRKIETLHTVFISYKKFMDKYTEYKALDLRDLSTESSRNALMGYLSTNKDTLKSAIENTRVDGRNTINTSIENNNTKIDNIHTLFGKYKIFIEKYKEYMDYKAIELDRSVDRGGTKGVLDGIYSSSNYNIKDKLNTYDIPNKDTIKNNLTEKYELVESRHRAFIDTLTAYKGDVDSGTSEDYEDSRFLKSNEDYTTTVSSSIGGYDPATTTPNNTIDALDTKFNDIETAYKTILSNQTADEVKKNIILKYFEMKSKHHLNRMKVYEKYINYKFDNLIDIQHFSKRGDELDEIKPYIDEMIHSYRIITIHKAIDTTDADKIKNDIYIRYSKSEFFANDASGVIDSAYGYAMEGNDFFELGSDIYNKTDALLTVAKAGKAQRESSTIEVAEQVSSMDLAAESYAPISFIKNIGTYIFKDAYEATVEHLKSGSDTIKVWIANLLKKLGIKFGEKTALFAVSPIISLFKNIWKTIRSYTLFNGIKKRLKEYNGDNEELKDNLLYSKTKTKRGFLNFLSYLIESGISALSRLMTIVSFGSSFIITETITLLGAAGKFLKKLHQKIHGFNKFIKGTRGKRRREAVVSMLDKSLEDKGDETTGSDEEREKQRKRNQDIEISRKYIAGLVHRRTNPMTNWYHKLPWSRKGEKATALRYKHVLHRIMESENNKFKEVSIIQAVYLLSKNSIDINNSSNTGNGIEILNLKFNNISITDSTISNYKLSKKIQYNKSSEKLEGELEVKVKGKINGVEFQNKTLKGRLEGSMSEANITNGNGRTSESIIKANVKIPINKLKYEPSKIKKVRDGIIEDLSKALKTT